MFAMQKRALVSVSNHFQFKKGERKKTSRHVHGASITTFGMNCRELLSLQLRHGPGEITELMAIFLTKSVSERISVG